MIQAFPLANLNRDREGQVKTVQFGGVQRIRVSSQCWKRAMRVSDTFHADVQTPIGTRTRKLVELLLDRLDRDSDDEDTVDAVRDVVQALLSQVEAKKEGNNTRVALYLSVDEVDELAASIEEHWSLISDPESRKTAIKAIGGGRDGFIARFKDRTSAPDIALFGRMMAEEPRLSMPAASQVADAFTTHTGVVEDDFFSVAEDVGQGRGSAMMGNTSCASGVFYRYVALDWPQLRQNLQDDDLAVKTARAFIGAAALVTPGGMSNRFAQFVRPNAMLGVVRTGGVPLNLANAFEMPVRSAAQNNGFVAPSVQAMLDHYARSVAMWEQPDKPTITQALLLQERPYGEPPADVVTVDSFAAFKDGLTDGL
jgi:CRISPR system Cascade subunit CasC